MKRTITIMAVLVSILATTFIELNAKNVTLKESWAAHTESSWYNSTSKAFHITTAKQLAHIASLVNSGNDNFAGDTIYIDNDIDLSGKYWEPIGKFEYRPFCGIIKGSNHTIKGLTICNIDSRTNISGSQDNLKDDDYFGGFVGVSYKAQFHDLTLVNSDIYAESATTKAISFRVATLVARLKGENSIINNCHSINPTIEAYCGILTPNKSANVDVAGLVGNIDDAPNTIIINSTVEGNSLTTNKYIGGIVGFISANSYNCTIMNSICSAIINNNSNLSYTSRNGGIVSAIDGSTIGNTTIKNCIFTGTINGGKYSHAILSGKPDGLANTNDHSEYCYYSPKSRAKNFNPFKQQWAQHYKSAAGASMTGNKNASTGTLLSDSHMTSGNSEAIIAIGGTNYTLIDALALVTRSYNNTAAATTPLARGIICDGTTYRIAGYSISNSNKI